MFKRTEESEWSRFSKAFASKDEKDPEPTSADSASADQGGGETLVGEAPARTGFQSSRPAGMDTNLTVARPSASAAAHPVYSPDEIESTIGEHTSFDGTLRAENSIRVRGSAQGEIECQKAVFIDENARVDAKVTAASITVAGEVNGELNCSGRVEIRPSGRVTGTINAATLVMQEGAFFDGNLRMRQSTPEAVGSS